MKKRDKIQIKLISTEAGDYLEVNPDEKMVLSTKLKMITGLFTFIQRKVTMPPGLTLKLAEDKIKINNLSKEQKEKFLKSLQRTPTVYEGIPLEFS